MQLVLQICPRR